MSTEGFYQELGGSRNVYAAIREGERYQADIGENLVQGFASGVNAPGSLVDDAVAYTINREMGRDTTISQKVAGFLAQPFIPDTGESQPLTKEQYQESRYYREDLPYEEGTTTLSAHLRARTRDLEKERSYVYDQSGRIGKLANFTSSLAGSVVDIKGATLSAATAASFGAAGSSLVARLGSRAIRTSGSNLTRTGVARVAAESTVATIPIAVSGVQNESATLRDYGLSDALLDLGASAILSSGIHVGSRKISEAYQARANLKEKQAVADLVQAQVRAGEVPDVTALVEMQMASKVQPFTTVDIDADTPRVRRVKGGRYEASFVKEEGLMKGVKGRGSTAEEATQSLKNIYSEDVQQAVGAAAESSEVLQLSKDLTDLEERINAFDPDSRMREIAREEGRSLRELEDAELELRTRQTTLGVVQARLRQRSSSAGRQTSVANAEQRVRESAQRVSTTAKEQLGDIQTRVAQEYSDLQQAARQVRKSLINAQVRRSAPGFQNFVQEQTDPLRSRDRASDPTVREARDILDDDLIAEAEANSASSLEQARQKLQARLDSEDLSTTEKQELRRELESLDMRNRRSDFWAKLKECLGGS